MLEGHTMEEVLIVRFSEIALKSPRIRRWMISRLRKNLEDALKAAGAPGRVEEKWERIYIWTEDVKKASEAAGRVFGVRSLSPAVAYEYMDLEDLIEKAATWAEERVRGRKFAVRARRDKDLPFTSMDIMVKLGERLKPLGEVDLTSPQVTVNVEVRGRVVYLFSEVLEGPGGLPLGTQGRALSLLSGGFDSAVSSWYVMRRGVELDYVTFSLAGPLQMRDALLVAGVLSSHWSHGYRPTLHLVDFSGVLDEIERVVQAPLRGVVLRHLFYRAAEMIADEEGHLSLVTGESLGQVSSQTLSNLSAASAGIGLPILRPLIGMDKEEIIGKAREIGTAELSEKVVEYCAIARGSSINLSRERFIQILKNMNLRVLEEAVEGRWKVKLPDGAPGALSEIESRIESWRYRGDEGEDVVRVNYGKGVQVVTPNGFPLTGRELKRALKGLKGGEGVHRLPRGFTYVFSCPTGGWAVRMVSLLRSLGYDAYYSH